ncbi:MAG: SPOR domain-containing protein [Bacteroidales bacterium]|nr:SPOR domain-containing protein [Bacteroidales bacterium]
MTLKNILFTLFFLSAVSAYSQFLSNNPYFHMLAMKSMTMKNGKVDFVEYKKEKGTKKPITNYYTLLFSKDIYYTSNNKKINIHFFRERDSVLYIVDDNASYRIDYKKKEVVIDERNEVILILRKHYPFAYFYSNQIGSELLLRGRLKDSVCTDFSTTMSFIERKNFTELYHLQKKNREKDGLDNYLLCYEDYEFRNKDTLLIRYVSKIRNPNRYGNGTITEIETKLLAASLEDTEYLKSYYYDYTNFCHNNFSFYDKRKSLQESNPAKNNRYTFLALEHEMMSLFLQMKNEQSKLFPLKKKWEENTALRILNMNLICVPAKQIVPSYELRKEEMPFVFAEEAIAQENEEEEVSENKQDAPVSAVETETATSDNVVAETFNKKETANIPIKDVYVKVFLKEDIYTNILTLKEIQTHLHDSGHIITVYYAVLGSFKDAENAAIFYARKKRTHNNIQKLNLEVSGYYLVGTGPYKTEEEAVDIVKENTDSWILRKEFYIAEPKQ